MKIITIKKDKIKINKIFDWFIHMIGYALILILISKFIGYPKFYVNIEYYGLWAFLIAVTIYFLNKTVKPIIFYLTLPITGLTLGLFYPFINVIILYITSYIMGNNFIVEGVFTLFLIAIMISIINILLEETILKKILKRSDRK